MSGACSITVWSHRGYSGAAVEHSVPGEAQLLSLAERGIRAFDVDLIFTADARAGEIYVAHPVALQSWLHIPDIQTARTAEWPRSDSNLWIGLLACR